MNLLTILHHQYLSRNRQLSHNQKGQPLWEEGEGEYRRVIYISSDGDLNDVDDIGMA